MIADCPHRLAIESQEGQPMSGGIRNVRDDLGSFGGEQPENSIPFGYGGAVGGSQFQGYYPTR